MSMARIWASALVSFGEKDMEALPELSTTDLDTLHDLWQGLPPGQAKALDPRDSQQNQAIRISLEAGGFTAAHSLAVDSDGNIYVGETLEGKRVQRFVRR